jgi:hypothetical protein
MIFFRYMFLQTPGQVASGEQDFMIASTAFQSDIRTQPDDFPVKAAAGMRFA